MVIKFDPANYEGPTGVVSFCSWSNPDLQKAIRQMFNESPRETITEVVIQRDGIKAKFESKNSTH